ncbi:hypothetical protein P692DRAFT_20831123, partial [Suillus brevipes Sb2]
MCRVRHNSNPATGMAGGYMLEEYDKAGSRGEVVFQDLPIPPRSGQKGLLFQNLGDRRR